MAAADEEMGQQPHKTIQPPQAQQRRKGIGVRVWLAVSDIGESRLEKVGKHSIMRRMGLPARDLRALDPVLSYPSSILGRERAIVVNLEHIKAIITAKEVLMLNSNNPLVIQFVEDLHHRISQQFDKGENVGGGSPFEFRALEACLESACRCLESEIQTLEEESYPALDELTSKISTLNLERVRQIKSRLVAISGRVQKVRDELEHLLDDDNDMAEIYLTEKLASHIADQTYSRELFDAELEEDDERDDDSKSEDNSEVYTGFKPKVEELEMILEAYFAHMSEYVDDTEDFG